MASIIPEYNYDIFISYRQKDNKHDGWISKFVDNLKGELESTFKEEISVYFDINPHDGLLETHDVDESLKEKLKCLVFIPIISRTYCDPKSFAWEHEFKVFVEQASQDQFGLKVKLPGGNVASRVLPVLIHDLDIDDMKLCESILGGAVRGVEFIYKSAGVNRPLRPKEAKPKDNLNNTDYRDQINKVANLIKEIILGLRIEPVEPSKEKILHREPISKIGSEVGSSKRLRSFKHIKNKLFTWATLVVFIAIIAIIAYPKIFSPGLPKPSICVFLPDPARTTEGAFYQDGGVQEEGFKQAIKDSEKLPYLLPIHYRHMYQEITADTLIEWMKDDYRTKGATFFIMTMSSKIEGVLNHFKNWHDSCLLMKKREPILIATIASAPGLADLKSGIVRYYIRSEEESKVLATNLKWEKKVEEVGIFYITRTDDRDDDTYGTNGRITFDKQFSSLDGIINGTYNTTSKTAKEKVTNYLLMIRSIDKLNEKDCGVFIVGYGDMVTNVYNELILQYFLGQIACSSTLTEPDWQPKNRNLDKQTFTVIPKVKDPSNPLAGDDRNVVFFFSKETLKRVLNITSLDSNPESFLDQWQSQPPASDRLEQEILANGDCAIQLEVIPSERWRQ